MCCACVKTKPWCNDGGAGSHDDTPRICAGDLAGCDLFVNVMRPVGVHSYEWGPEHRQTAWTTLLTAECRRHTKYGRTCVGNVGNCTDYSTDSDVCSSMLSGE
jgi:hypothetical protein